MKKVYLLLLPFIFFSCEKATDCCTVIDTSIDIQYKAENGGNWLNQQELNEHNINIYFIKEGQKEKINRGNLDAPKIFLIYQDDLGKEIFRLFPSDYLEHDKSRTLIEFSSTDVDTVDCLFNTRNNNIICEEVWYNGVSVWNTGQSSPRLIVINKE